MKRNTSNIRGQSLFEMIIAISVSAIIIGSVTTAIIMTLQSGQRLSGSQKAYSVAQGVSNNMRSYLEANWAEVYSTSTKGVDSTFYLSENATTSEYTTLTLINGTTTIDITEEEGIKTYTSWSSIEDVWRDITDGNIETATTSDDLIDPSTFKVTTYVTWLLNGETAQIDITQYVSQLRSDLFYDKPSITDGYFESSIFDTRATNGFSINSIIWEGTYFTGAYVRFQLAVSNATLSGWTDDDFKGPDGTHNTYYGGLDLPGTTIHVNSSYHHPYESGYKYFRYRIDIDQNTATSSPIVDDININWSH